jgi:hypothetical protein
MSREYYVIKPLPIDEDDDSLERGYELLKYNTNKQVSSRGCVYKTKEGTFTCDDAGFKYHKNEDISRRVRIVKKHIELGEPKFAAYWFGKKGIDCFKV